MWPLLWKNERMMDGMLIEGRRQKAKGKRQKAKGKRKKEEGKDGGLDKWKETGKCVKA